MEYEYTVDEEYEDAVLFPSSWSMDNPEMVASDAGEHFYDCDPDPEMFPLELEIFGDGKSYGVFEVYLEFSPSFTAAVS